MSPLLVVGSYGSATTPTVRALRLVPAAGELRPMGELAGIPNASFVLAGRPGTCFVTSETRLEADGAAGSVVSLAVAATESGAVLEPTVSRPTSGDLPCHLARSGDGRWLAVSNYGDGSCALVRIATDGRLGDPADVVRHTGSGPHPRQMGPHVHGSLFLGDDRFLVVADLGIDALVVYAVDGARGRLERRTEVPTEPGAGPRQLAAHPDGRHVFVVNELANTLTVHRHDPETGGLEVVGSLPTVPDGAPPNLAADVRIAASGDRVHVSNRGHDSVASFAFDPQAGLAAIGTAATGGAGPRGLALSPDGRWLAVANEAGDEVTILAISSDGTATNVVARAPVPAPAGVAFVEAGPGRPRP